jgi:sterol carrier protein 2
MTGIPIYNINNNGATGSATLHVCYNLIRGGVYSCGLALGFEKMQKGSLPVNFPDRTNPLDRSILRADELCP